MQGTDKSQLDFEQISALMDGGLRDAEAAQALQTACGEAGSERWQLYHLVGDVLRDRGLAACGHDAGFVSRLSAELAREPREPRAVVLAPQPADSEVPRREAANDALFRWKMVAGVASFAAVAALGWMVAGGAGLTTPDAELARADVPAQALSLAAAPTTYAASAAGPQGDAVMLRDARLDELLAAHRQAAGASALSNASGFLRNATFEGPAR